MLYATALQFWTGEPGQPLWDIFCFPFYNGQSGQYASWYFWSLRFCWETAHPNPLISRHPNPLISRHLNPLISRNPNLRILVYMAWAFFRLSWLEGFLFLDDTIPRAYLIIVPNSPIFFNFWSELWLLLIVSYFCFCYPISYQLTAPPTTPKPQPLLPFLISCFSPFSYCSFPPQLAPLHSPHSNHPIR